MNAVFSYVLVQLRSICSRSEVLQVSRDRGTSFVASILLYQVFYSLDIVLILVASPLSRDKQKSGTRKQQLHLQQLTLSSSR
jgi:hypothetical protein